MISTRARRRATLFAAAALAGISADAAGAMRHVAEAPPVAPAVSQYVESMPTSKGPQAVNRGAPPTPTPPARATTTTSAPATTTTSATQLPPSTLNKVRKLGGGDAATLERVVGDAPSERGFHIPKAAPASASVATAATRNSHAFLFLLLGIAGSGTIAWAFVVARSRWVRPVRRT